MLRLKRKRLLIRAMPKLSEFMRYKSEAERLEKGFQEILGSVQESRLSWVQEVREGVAESIQIALHHIAQHPKLQAAILAQKLSEAMTHSWQRKRSNSVC